MSAIAINPPASRFGSVNAVLSARGSRHHMSRFAGPLSLKCVIAGSAVWETAQGRYELVPGAVLLLNDGEEYEITVESLKPVETFCFFFERGFVEDAVRATNTASASLLDSGGQAILPVQFAARLQFDAPLVAELQRAHARMLAGEELEPSFYAAALELVRVQCDVAARIEQLPAMRASTRTELARRVGIATSFLHANLDRNVSIAEAAREACLSPFHFHRLFAALHGVPPHRYVTRLRLERARTLLRSTDALVADVAFRCGFESVGSFTTRFTRAFGIAPARFRKNREIA